MSFFDLNTLLIAVSIHLTFRCIFWRILILWRPRMSNCINNGFALGFCKFNSIGIGICIFISIGTSIDTRHSKLHIHNIKH